MSIISKIKTLLWFLGSPKYYSQLVALIINRLRGDEKENSRDESEKWCRERVIDTQEFVARFTQNHYEKLQVLYPEIFENANAKIESLPVKMGGAGDLELLYFLCEHLQATQVIETGVAAGWSSLSILLSLSKRENSRLVSNDMPYAKMGNEEFVGCVIPEVLKEKWTLIRKPDLSGLPQALNIFKSIDLCHYDSDKTYQGRMFAYPILWEKLRINGVFVSDDIGDNIGFKDFCERLNKTPYIIGDSNRYVGVIIKDE